MFFPKLWCQKSIEYIKHKGVILLKDSGTPHKFIHRRVVEETQCYVHVVHNFQIMIDNGGTTKCCGKCENVKLGMGNYSLKFNMFSIEMGGCDVVLG